MSEERRPHIDIQKLSESVEKKGVTATALEFIGDLLSLTGQLAGAQFEARKTKTPQKGE